MTLSREREREREREKPPPAPKSVPSACRRGLVVENREGRVADETGGRRGGEGGRSVKTRYAKQAANLNGPAQNKWPHLVLPRVSSLSLSFLFPLPGCSFSLALPTTLLFSLLLSRIHIHTRGPPRAGKGDEGERMDAPLHTHTYTATVTHTHLYVTRSRHSRCARQGRRHTTLALLSSQLSLPLSLSLAPTCLSLARFPLVSLRAPRYTCTRRQRQRWRSLLFFSEREKGKERERERERARCRFSDTGVDRGTSRRDADRVADVVNRRRRRRRRRRDERAKRFPPESRKMAALAAPARPSLLACLPSFGSPRTDVADTRMPPPCVGARKEREYVRAGECTRAHAHTAPRRRPPDRSLAGARVCACVLLRMRLSVCAVDVREYARSRRSTWECIHSGARALTPHSHPRQSRAHVSARRTAEREGTLNLRRSESGALTKSKTDRVTFNRTSR